MRGAWAKGDGVLQVFNTVSVEDCADKCDVEKSDVCFGFSYVRGISLLWPGTMPPQP